MLHLRWPESVIELGEIAVNRCIQQVHHVPRRSPSERDQQRSAEQTRIGYGTVELEVRGI
jgi:hypothetical protein